MSATGEGEVATAEQPPVEVPASTEQPQPEEKPAKEKKTKAPKEKKPKAPKEKKPKPAKTASHPPYFQMIKEALMALNEKGGLSPYRIAKFMEEKHKDVLPANFRKILALQLKNSAAKGKLIKIRASYKLVEIVKKGKGASKAEKPVAINKAETRSSTAPRTKAVKKIETVKKPAKKVGAKKTKKSAPAKPKQPKSIKSPAAKKAKKATA